MCPHISLNHFIHAGRFTNLLKSFLFKNDLPVMISDDHTLFPMVMSALYEYERVKECAYLNNTIVCSLFCGCITYHMLHYYDICLWMLHWPEINFLFHIGVVQKALKCKPLAQEHLRMSGTVNFFDMSSNASGSWRDWRRPTKLVYRYPCPLLWLLVSSKWIR